MDDPLEVEQPSVLLDVRPDGVAIVTLNRPERLNAWNMEMERRYIDTLDECDRREDVRVIVVTGAGRGFCAGADFDALQDTSANGADLPADKPSGTAPLAIRKPMIAAINGACAGAGLIQALMCDVRFVAAEARLTFAFTRLGLIAEYGVAWVLTRLVGTAAALDLLVSSRVFDGAEATRLGLASRALPAAHVLDEALEYAAYMATNCSPRAMAAIKSQVMAATTQDLQSALAEADRLMTTYLAHPDFAEGVRSVVEKKPPRFKPIGGSVA